MLLEKYIRYRLKENFGHKKINDLVRRLNDKSQECIDYFTSKRREKSIPYKIYGYILEAIEELNLEFIASGESREAYTISGEEWVLKVAKNQFGSEVLQQEIDISESVHGLGARDLFVEVYDFDKINEKPMWIICQKVEILHDFEDFDSLTKMFPTFWNAIKEKNKSAISVDYFKSLISDTLYEMANSRNYSLSQKRRMFEEYKQLEKEIEDEYRKILDVTLSGGKESRRDYTHYNELVRKLNTIKNKFEYSLESHVDKNMFYEAMISASPKEEIIKSIDDIQFSEDFRRIAKAFAYIKTDDLHDENIGIVPSSNPNPNDFVILDFMI
jgi:hypothetical protein